MPASSTIILSRTIALASARLRFMPLQITNNDPAFSDADWVRQFILASPFAWNWNRFTVTFTCVVGQQDYVESAATFGWIEKATYYDSTQSENPTKELTVRLTLGEETVEGEPFYIAAQNDDGAGNIKFRLHPVPQSTYVVTVTCQARAPLFTAANQTWAPIPDSLSYLYNLGFFAKACEYAGDERFGASMALFLREVIAANGGLEDTEVNIFLQGHMNLTREVQGTSIAEQQSRAARAGQ
jgi:hypothetical protein